MPIQTITSVSKNANKSLVAFVVLLFLLLTMLYPKQVVAADIVSKVQSQEFLTTTSDSQKVLIVGSEQDYPPFSTGMTDATAGGFTVELWKAVAAEAGLKYTIRVRPFHELLQDFKAGKIDVLLNLATTSERHQFADFSVPHAIIHGGIFVRKNETEINNENDLIGKSVIVLNADLGQEYAVSKGLTKQLTLVDTTAEGLLLLASGKHDAMLVSKLAGLQTLQKLNITNVKVLKADAGFQQKFAFAVKEGDFDQFSQINEALLLTKSNGTYDDLYDKWFGVYEKKEVTLIDILNYLLPILVCFLAYALYSIHRRRVENRVSQKKLQDSEEHLRLSQKGGGIGTWEYNLIDNNQFWSENCLELLGLNTSTQPTWENFLSLILPEDRQQVTDAMQAHITDGKKFEVLYRALHSNGEIRWLRSTGQTEFDLNGKPVKVRGIAQDITERKQIEDKLIESENRSTAIIEASPIPFALNDNQGNITYLNSAFLKLIGYTLNDIPTLSDWWPLAYPDAKYQKIVAVQWQRRIDEAYSNNTPFEPIEVNICCKDGNTRTFICNAVRLAKHLATNHLVMFYDITERKRAEEELKKLRNSLLESRDKYEDLYEFAPTGYLSLNQHGLIIELNWKVTAMLGLPRKEISQRRFNEFVCDEDKAHWQETYSEIKNLIAGEEINIDLKLIHSKGSVFNANLNCLRMDDDVQAMVRITLVDVSKLKEIESKLIRNETYLKTIIESEPECIKVVDANGILMQMNPAGLEMLDAENIEQINNVSLIKCIAPEFQGAFADLHQRVIAGESMQLEFEAISLKGSRRWLETHAVQMNVDDKKLVLAVTRDITSRKQAELRVEKLLAEQTAILDNKMVGIAIARDRKIIWANLAYEIMFGYSKKELTGMSTRNLYSNDEDYLEIGKAYAQIANEGIVRKQYAFVRKSGEKVWMNLSGTMLNHGHDESLWIFVDVTEQKLAELAAIEARNLLETLINAAPIRIFWKDTDSRYLGCNFAFAKDAGKSSPQEIIGKNDFDMTWAAQAELYRADDQAVMTSGIAKLTYDEPQQTPDGKTIWLSTSKTPIKNSRNESTGILGVYDDITERVLAENELRIAAIAFESQEGMMITDANRNVLRVNRAFTNITGYSTNEIVGKNPSILSSGQHGASFYEAMWKRIHEQGFWQGDIWNKRKSGEVYPEHLTITVVKDNNDVITNYVATLTDITMSKAAAEEIQHLAFYDSLTKLPNRRLLVDRLTQAMTSSARNLVSGAVLFMDIDHFKTLNDTLGHDIGDVLLQQVASRLISCVREGDTVARLGGDEYVVMLEHLSENTIEAAAQAEVVAKKILTSLNLPYQLGNNEYNGTASIGIAVFGDKNQSQDEILKYADIAMYQAKKSGGNTLRFFDPKMQDAIYHRVSLENDLRKAIENEEFEMYYQVQVGVSNEPLGAEALIRWNHPTKGLLTPFKFIQLAEEIGLILPIGQWVLDSACAQLKAWEQNEYFKHLAISINVSAKQFSKSEFATHVKEAIQRHAINPELLKLELTESMLIDHIDNIIITMVALQSIGVRFELDDFGTGYSSLQYLKQLPLHQLKIDQSFVRDIATDNSDQAIVRTIIVMAHSLNLEVIAEGVENELQRQFLIDTGCDHLQGYLFGRPVPIGEFEASIKLIERQ